MAGSVIANSSSVSVSVVDTSPVRWMSLLSLAVSGVVVSMEITELAPSSRDFATSTALPSFQKSNGKAPKNRSRPNRIPPMDSLILVNQDLLVVSVNESFMKRS